MATPPSRTTASNSREHALPKCDDGHARAQRRDSTDGDAHIRVPKLEHPTRLGAETMTPSCLLCGRPYATALSCVPCDGVYVFGSEPGYELGSSSEVRCPDCGVTVGGSHHLGCTVAWCHGGGRDHQRFCCEHQEVQVRDAGLDLP